MHREHIKKLLADIDKPIYIRFGVLPNGKAFRVVTPSTGLKIEVSDLLFSRNEREDSEFFDNQASSIPDDGRPRLSGKIAIIRYYYEIKNKPFPEDKKGSYPLTQTKEFSNSKRSNTILLE